MDLDARMHAPMFLHFEKQKRSQYGYGIIHDATQGGRSQRQCEWLTVRCDVPIVDPIVDPTGARGGLRCFFF